MQDTTVMHLRYEGKRGPSAAHVCLYSIAAHLCPYPHPLCTAPYYPYQAVHQAKAVCCSRVCAGIGGHSKAIEALLAGGADANIQDSAGKGCLLAFMLQLRRNTDRLKHGAQDAAGGDGAGQ